VVDVALLEEVVAVAGRVDLLRIEVPALRRAPGGERLQALALLVSVGRAVGLWIVTSFG